MKMVISSLFALSCYTPEYIDPTVTLYGGVNYPLSNKRGAVARQKRQARKLKNIRARSSK